MTSDRLRGVPGDAWDEPSLCAGWTVRHVLADLVTPSTVTAPAMAVAVARCRSIDRAMDAAARRIVEDRDPDDLVAILEENAASGFRPPGLPLAAALTDAVVPSADVRRARQSAAVQKSMSSSTAPTRPTSRSV